MKHLYTTLICCLLATLACAQKTEPLYEAYFSHPDEMIQDENGGYHFKVGSQIVAMSDDGYYKLMNAEGVVLEEGDTDEGDSDFQRHGKWIEYYPSGKTKASGSYYHNQPYGHWQLFDEQGNLSSEYDIMVIAADDGTTGYCKAGTELVYHSNGKIKEEHFFKAEPYNGEDRILVEDPETGKKAWKKIAVKAYRPRPFGTWNYYSPEGKVEKREDK